MLRAQNLLNLSLVIHIWKHLNPCFEKSEGVLDTQEPLLATAFKMYDSNIYFMVGW